MTVPFADHISSQMEEQLSETPQKAYMGLSLVPDTLRSDTQWREKVKGMITFYETGLPSPLSLETGLETVGKVNGHSGKVMISQQLHFLLFITAKVHSSLIFTYS